MNKRLLAVIVVVIALPSIAAHRRVVAPQPTPPALDAMRSFAVLDITLLDDGFPFERVMNAIVAGTSTTGEQLIRQMFDTQNPSPGMADSASPHCDDFLVNGTPTFNGFPRRCPTPEATLAATPFARFDYRALALINRFDMAPADGANCGQYRIVYESRRTTDVHVIFEAVLPNPHRELGIAGCKPVAQFWADLSSVDSLIDRRMRLERFFFDGIDGFEPVVRADHYTQASGGGIRTRQVVFQPKRWRGYQFRVARACPPAGTCAMRLVPDVIDNVPFGPMFDANVDTPAARAFRQNFLTQIATLAINDINQFSMNVDRQFLLGESDPVDDFFAFNYVLPFVNSQSTDAGKAFRGQIDAELKRVGSSLTPEDIVARAQTQTCNGCHFFQQSVGGGLFFPTSFEGDHVIEIEVPGPPGSESRRWTVSPAVEKVFLPNRVRILREFLQYGKAPEHSN